MPVFSADDPSDADHPFAGLGAAVEAEVVQFRTDDVEGYRQMLASNLHMMRQEIARLETKLVDLQNIADAHEAALASLNRIRR